MGKSRRRGGSPTNSNNGERPVIGDLEIPESRDTITELPSENPGQKTTLQKNEEKIQEELNQLYADIIEADMERSGLWRDYYNTQKKVSELQEQLKTFPDNTTSLAKDVKKQLDKANQQLGEALTLAQNQQEKYDEMNRRITELQTGFDTGEKRDWGKELAPPKEPEKKKPKK